MSESEIEACSFEDLFELAAKAKEDGVRAKQRTDEQWFRYDDVGMICLWEPGNRSSTKRISHWWVHPDRRGSGIGTALFEHAIKHAEQSSAETLDIYSYDPEFVESYGFEHHPESSQAMDDAQYYQRPIDKQ